MNPLRLVGRSVGWAGRRGLAASAAARAKHIRIEDQGQDVHIYGEPMKEAGPPPVAQTLQVPLAAPEACVLCRLGVSVEYSDVLILEQFMRQDGTVLPPEVTGLCKKQQQRVQDAVLQGHWSGLYESSPEGLGWRKFRRHWTDPREVWERNLEVRAGSWYYVNRTSRREAGERLPKTRGKIATHRIAHLKRMGYDTQWLN